MPKVRIKHVEEFVDRLGKIRLYYRNKSLGGKRIPLRQPKGSPEFWEDYHAAAGSPAARATNREGSIEWLVNKYYGSAAFTQLSERTKYVRRGLLNGFCKKHGEKRFAQLQPRHIRTIRDELAETPGQANNVLKALRQVFRYAVEYEHVTSNPVLEVPYLAPRSNAGFHAWSLAEIEKFEACHPVGTKARLALGLLLYTGQRRGDIVKLGPRHQQAGWLTFTQQKTKKMLSIPILSDLKQIIDECPTGSVTYLETEFGKPFTSNGFGNWWRRRCDEAGLPHCSAHGLRKAAGYRMAERGCTVHEIASVLGHDTLKEVERYTKAAEQRRLAKNAQARIEGAFSQTSSPTFPNREEDEEIQRVMEEMVPRGVAPAVLHFNGLQLCEGENKGTQYQWVEWLSPSSRWDRIAKVRGI